MDITNYDTASFLFRTARILSDFPQDEVYYLATPYSKYPGGVGAALRLANWATAGLADAGYTCVSPILQFHGAQQLLPRLSGEWEHWKDHNKRLIERLPALVFLHVGTASLYSTGMRAEFQAFTALGKPTYVWEPGTAHERPLLSLVPHTWDPWAELPPEPELRSEDQPNALKQLANNLKRDK